MPTFFFIILKWEGGREEHLEHPNERRRDQAEEITLTGESFRRSFSRHSPSLRRDPSMDVVDAPDDEADEVRKRLVCLARELGPAVGKVGAASFEHRLLHRQGRAARKDRLVEAIMETMGPVEEFDLERGRNWNANFYL